MSLILPSGDDTILLCDLASLGDFSKSPLVKHVSAQLALNLSLLDNKGLGVIIFHTCNSNCEKDIALLSPLHLDQCDRALNFSLRKHLHRICSTWAKERTQLDQEVPLLRDGDQKP